jgi:hypothetical protein
MKGQPHFSVWCLSNILHEEIPAATNETTAPSPQTNLDAAHLHELPKFRSGRRIYNLVTNHPQILVGVA